MSDNGNGKPPVRPCDDAGERALLTAMVAKSDKVMPRLAGVTSLGNLPEAFYSVPRQILARRIIEIYEKTGAVDRFMVQGEMERDAEFAAEVGARDAVMGSLEEKDVQWAHGCHYFEKLWDLKRRRDLLDLSEEIATIARKSDTPLEELMAAAESKIYAAHQGHGSRGLRHWGDALERAYGSLVDGYKHRGQIAGLASGFHALDELTRGFLPGQVIVIAGRPSHGKTSLALNIGVYAAGCRGISTVKQANPVPVAIFSAEMTDDELGQRAICSLARVNSKTATNSGFLAESDMPKMKAAKDELRKHGVFIEDVVPVFSEIYTEARQKKMSEGIGMIIIDYLQLLTTESRDPEELQLARISKGVKKMAKELEVPVLLLSQLNREIDKRAGKSRKPKLSDLRGSGAIEQDADICMAIERPALHGPTPDAFPGTPDEWANLAFLHVLKQRNGGTGEVHLIFEREFSSFANSPTKRGPWLPDPNQRHYNDW